MNKFFHRKHAFMKTNYKNKNPFDMIKYENKLHKAFFLSFNIFNVSYFRMLKNMGTIQP